MTVTVTVAGSSDSDVRHDDTGGNMSVTATTSTSTRMRPLVAWELTNTCRKGLTQAAVAFTQEGARSIHPRYQKLVAPATAARHRLGWERGPQERSNVNGRHEPASKQVDHPVPQLLTPSRCQALAVPRIADPDGDGITRREGGAGVRRRCCREAAAHDDGAVAL